jgi:flagellar biosynthesis protein FlhG
MNTKRDPLIWTIASGKGGVGKSLICLNVGLKLALAGKRSLIVEADLGLSNLSILTNLSPNFFLEDVLLENCELNQALISYQKNLDLLPASTNSELKKKIGENEVAKLFSWLERVSSYEVILIDCGAGLSEKVLTFVDYSPLLCVLVTPEPTSIASAYALVKLAHAQDKEKEIALLFNRVNSSSEAFSLKEKFDLMTQSFLGFKTSSLGYVLEDSKALNSVLTQTPLLLSQPDSVSSISLEKVAQRLLREEGNSHYFRNFQDKNFSDDKEKRAFVSIPPEGVKLNSK